MKRTSNRERENMRNYQHDSMGTVELSREYPNLTAAETRKLLYEWNDTAADYPSDKCVHHLFEEQVIKSPDAIAVVYEEEQATYSELNAMANRLAHYLVKQGAAEDTIVAICMERGIDMIAVLLAISKTGATYLPLDPIYPKARQELILEDAKPSLFITQTSVLDKIPQSEAEIILIDEKEKYADEPSGNLAFGNAYKPLYVLFTSGSTGKPKGVAVLQRSTINVVNAFSKLLRVTPKDIVFTVTTIAFDLAELDIYLALLNGGKVVLGTREAAMSMELLMEKIESSHATIFQATPVTHRMLVQAGWKGKKDLKIISGGDAMSKELGKELLQRTQEVWNSYGPTETTIYNTTKMVVPADTEGEGIVTIGRPFDNNTMYILDSEMNPVPIGTAGELYIGGDGLSPGYLNHPEMTAAKFVRNPFSEKPGDLIYKSGDLIKYLPDGNMAFITRIDNQVKIRGFRIELGEIESALASYPGIKEAVVIARENNSGEKILVAFYTTEAENSIKSAQIRAFLQSKLPEYMIPSVVSKLDKIPLTANNKFDRKTLSATALPEIEEDGNFVAPSTPDEIRLALIWKEILKIDKVGIHTGFFELGGHSLTAAQLIARIKKEFGVTIPFRAVFERITISGLLEQMKHPEAKVKEGENFITHTDHGRDVFPLSSSQSRIWFLEKFDPGMIAYNLPMDFSISGKLDIAVLEKSLRFLVGRHASFRTVFPMVNGEPLQKILPEVPVNLQTITLENENEKLPSLIKSYSLENAKHKFNLETGPLFRFQLLVTGESEFIFLINIHHIISDAISQGIFLEELNNVYHSYILEEPINLPTIPVSYADFTLWQNQWLAGEACRKEIDFWKEELSGAPDLLQLPLDYRRPKTMTYTGREAHLPIDPGLKVKLTELSRKKGTGLSITLLSAFAGLVYRYTSQEDFVLGFPVANRTLPELEALTGVFINTLPIRFNFPAGVTFSEVMQHTLNKFLSAYENQEVPVEKLVDEMKVTRSMNISPVFQVLFNYLTGFPDSFQLPGALMQQRRGERISSQFDLTLTVNDVDEGLDCAFEYNTDLFREDTINRLMGHYLTLLNAVVENEERTINSIPILTPPEQKTILDDWNNTSVSFPGNKCIHDIFEEQARRTPDSIAVVFEKEQLTYAELNERANRLAHYLQKQGAKEGTFVAICLRRGLDLITGLLAISKTGATYLPLDPIYPKARLALILEDAKPLFLLTESFLKENLPETCRLVLLDTRELYADESPENLHCGNSLNSAYILYTSGSTGKPKGVQIRHKSVINLVASMGKLMEISEDDIILAETTISFDIAELEMYLPLFSGARLVIASEETSMNADMLKNKIDECGATIFQATPVTYKMMVLSGWKGKPDLKLICGGEALSKELARELLPRCKELWNAYGPTETTIWSVVKKVRSEDAEGEGYVAIGKPLDNTTLYVLNPERVPVPVGVAGELYIGGEGVSTGYLNLPEMNEERFVHYPLNSGEASRVYRTGDLVHYMSNGDLMFINRVDSQVKIRGFRVELGEIESAISQYKDIKENVVVARKDEQGETMLVAYCVGNTGTSPDEAGLRLYLREKLPEYMVPAAIVTLEKLPLTGNNKIDRKALPDPGSVTSANSGMYVEPKTGTERKLAAIWSSILKIDKIGTQDDFFAIGGHSMIAVTLIIKIEKEFGIRLPLATLFDQRTIQRLAKIIENGVTPDKWRSLVTLRPGGSKKPLFLVHGLGLNVLLYTTIINYLDPEQPVYGLQAKGLNGVDKPLETIEEVASYYISEIMNVDREGPYQLAGYSLGGQIAYEMGRQLKEMGKQVSFVGLFDTVAESSVSHLPISLQIKLKSSYLLNYLSWNISYFFKAAKESRISVIRRRWRGLEKKVRGLDIKVSGQEKVSKGERRELPKYLRKVHQANLRAGRNYILRPYHGPVHLFKAAHQTFYIADPVNYGWAEYATGGVIVHETPGEHSSTFAPPNDKYFASILQKSLDETMRQA